MKLIVSQYTTLQFPPPPPPLRDGIPLPPSLSGSLAIVCLCSIICLSLCQYVNPVLTFWFPAQLPPDECCFKHETRVADALFLRTPLTLCSEQGGHVGGWNNAPRCRFPRPTVGSTAVFPFQFPFLSDSHHITFFYFNTARIWKDIGCEECFAMLSSVFHSLRMADRTVGVVGTDVWNRRVNGGQSLLEW